ncbi:ATP-grasp domain-containing protein [Streptomyces sp. NRRL F-5193]|uniref:ATP-grasp domain-containing protein n=1 Tax=Streptomyces sp. NRRL F-5193 TaxID=1463860 RepID=UPI0005BDF0BC|nr:ATP-grasp domain-containing protein [Streptomyces sp. NRRL F-5193]
MSQRPLVLVVAPGDDVYRGYCLRQVADAYDVAVLTTGPLTWEKQYVVDHETVPAFDDVDALLGAAEAITTRRPVAGVLTWNESHLTAVAQLAERLGLAVTTPESVRTCRDKAASRAAFARHGVPSARSVAAASLDEALAVAEAIGFPVVVKPAAVGGSIGVIKAETREDLAEAYAFATRGVQQHGGDNCSVLVEEYLSGPEVSVECVTYQGVTTPVAVTRKELGDEPLFEETGHTLTAGDPLLETVAPIAKAAVRATGVTGGIQHVEIRLTPTGPRVIEVNGRIGGDWIGWAVEQALGLPLARIAADIAVGAAPDLTPTRQEAVAIQVLYAPASGTLTQRSIASGFAETAGWVHGPAWLIEEGDEVLLPPKGDLDSSRVGLIATYADTIGLAVARRSATNSHIALAIDVPAPGRP